MRGMADQLWRRANAPRPAGRLRFPASSNVKERGSAGEAATIVERVVRPGGATRHNTAGARWPRRTQNHHGTDNAPPVRIPPLVARGLHARRAYGCLPSHARSRYPHATRREGRREGMP